MTEILTIKSMAYQGAGVAHAQNGKTLFVDGAVVGDVVKVIKSRSFDSYDMCLAFELLEPSPHRIATPCPYAEVCGGCPWQMFDYEQQRYWKRQFVVDALERIAKIEISTALVGECIPSPQRWHYRNKVELSVFMQDGKLKLGLCRKKSHEHISIDSCLLMPKPFRGMPKKLAGALNYALEKENKKKLVRVAIRSSYNTGSAEAALFMLPSGVNRALLAKVLNENASFSSVVRPLVKGDMAARKVKQLEVLSGAGHWKETLAHNSYRISAPSFFQINSATAELMIVQLMKILDTLELDAGASVADLYSGVGMFTLPLARRFKQVSAIESYGSSIRDLRHNLDVQGLDARIIGGDVARELAQLQPAELVLVNPPRSGLKPQALKALCAFGAPHLIYVSCNPSTLARDIALLVQESYQLVSATPLDQFPQSYHVETLVLLQKSGG